MTLFYEIINVFDFNIFFLYFVVLFFLTNFIFNNFAILILIALIFVEQNILRFTKINFFFDRSIVLNYFLKTLFSTIVFE